ncbi:MAG: RtcB family protein [Clostridia bacterium]|nr:RtcB family protein [Clostridia bacterium]
MIDIKGLFNTATVYTNNLDRNSHDQIQKFLDSPLSEGSTIRFMPDVHAGKGCTIGTTMTLTDKICPAIVGVDVSCGMYVTRLEEKIVDLRKLDKVIHEHIPAGLDKIRDKPLDLAYMTNVEDLICGIKSRDKALRSIGSLGGGNHFIEMDKDSNGCLYLVIHTGSRNVGAQVAYKWQNKAIKQIQLDGLDDIVPEELSYLTGKSKDQYLHDMKIAQEYADVNRQAIARVIMTHMGLHPVQQFTTVHNYIDLTDGMTRKGAVRAHKDELLIVPMNMRDGSLLCVGKGNPDWNESAPHGAGRLLSRLDAREKIDLDEYRKTMSGVYTTSVNEHTLDEAPQAYKPMSEIVSQIQDTVTIIDTLKPVYNFKA